jgi:ribosome-associated protein
MQENEQPSRTRRKLEAEALQQLGKQLITVSESDLQRLQLPEQLIEALREARRIHSHNAQKRHLQYIGKLMRDIDPEPVRQYFEAHRLAKNVEVQKHHQLEEMRDTLIIGGEKAVDSFIQDYPGANRKQLCHLVRQANRERASGHPPKSAREIFRYLKGII